MDIQEIDSIYKLDIFLKSGGDINTPTREGNLLLTLSQKNGNEKLINKIIRKGIDVNKLDSYNRNALSFELAESTVKLLIKKGINVNQKDNENLTPLFYHKSSSIMKLLIKHGCDPLHVDKKNKTFAHDNKFSNVLSKLKRDEEVQEKIEKDYVEKIKIAFEVIPLNFQDDYGLTVTDYVDWSFKDPSIINDLISVHIQYNVSLNLMKQLDSFILFSQVLNKSENVFLLGELLIQNAPDFLFSIIEKDFVEYKKRVKINHNDPENVKKFKQMFAKEIVKKEKEKIWSALNEPEQTKSIKRRM